MNSPQPSPYIHGSIMMRSNTKYVVMIMNGTSVLPNHIGKNVICMGVYKVYDPNHYNMTISKYWELILQELHRKGYVGQVQLKVCSGNPHGASPHARYNQIKERTGLYTVRKCLVDTDEITELELL